MRPFVRVDGPTPATSLATCRQAATREGGGDPTMRRAFDPRGRDMRLTLRGRRALVYVRAATIHADGQRRSRGRTSIIRRARRLWEAIAVSAGAADPLRGGFVTREGCAEDPALRDIHRSEGWAALPPTPPHKKPTPIRDGDGRHVRYIGPCITAVGVPRRFCPGRPLPSTVVGAQTTRALGGRSPPSPDGRLDGQRRM
jgi:hypothetical protein